MYTFNAFKSSYINVHVLSTQVISVVSLYGEEEESESIAKKMCIKSIPPPKILSFSGINRSLREIESSNMLNFSMELFVSWGHPQFDREINSYEIYFGVGNNFFHEYDHLHEEVGLVSTWISYSTFFIHIHKSCICESSWNLFCWVQGLAVTYLYQVLCL